MSFAHLNQFVLKVAARQSNPVPNDADATFIELVDLSTHKVIWRGTVAQLDGFMRGDPNTWTDADLQSVRSMVNNRSIKGVYVNGDSILRRAQNPSESEYKTWMVVTDDDDEPCSFYTYAEDALDGVQGDDTKTVLRMMRDRGFPKVSPVEIPMQGCGGPSTTKIYRSRAELRAANPRKRKGQTLDTVGYETDVDEHGNYQVRREHIDTSNSGDYGADPLGEDEHGVFHWRMVPSGDVVNFEEKERRLHRRNARTSALASRLARGES